MMAPESLPLVAPPDALSAVEHKLDAAPRPAMTGEQWSEVKSLILGAQDVWWPLWVDWRHIKQLRCDRIERIQALADELADLLVEAPDDLLRGTAAPDPAHIGIIGLLDDLESQLERAYASVSDEVPAPEGTEGLPEDQLRTLIGAIAGAMRVPEESDEDLAARVHALLMQLPWPPQDVPPPYLLLSFVAGS